MEAIYNDILSNASAETWKEAEEWYPSANRFCSFLAKRYDRDLATVAAVMAVFSIRTTWKDNKRRLVRYLATGEARGTKLQLKKLRDIEKAEGNIRKIMDVLRGDKIKRFFHNILFFLTSPYATIDSWMISPLPDISYGQLPRKYGSDRTMYQQVEAIIRGIARKLRKPVATVQACIWIILRGKGH